MQHSSPQRPLAARPAGPLSGTAVVPGDKSISHRALILGALAVGESSIAGLLDAEDVQNTADAVRALGATVLQEENGRWHVWGVGVGGFGEPANILDFGNSGTGCRLVMGAVATTPIVATFTGDASLRKRPMGRVLKPLELFGAEATAREGGLLPVTMRGAHQALRIEHEVKVASAQVKSALLLAALNAAGRSRISQIAPTRDHTEKMLKAFGADIEVETFADGSEAIEVTGERELRPTNIDVPRDPSSAAFPIAAALLVPGSEISIPGLLLNPRRIGLIETLRAMGARISIEGRRQSGGEDVGDLRVMASTLRGLEVPAEHAPSMIDEYPILAILAAFAEGRTVMRGLEELRVKESDRLSAIAQGLSACGVKVEELPDGLIVEGRGLDGVPGGAQVETHLDHRIAMSFLVAGLAAQNEIGIDDARMIATSFPQFEHLMLGLGAQFTAPKA